MAYVLEHAEARFAVVEDQEQVDKLLEVMARCPYLEHIVYDEPRGLRHYTQLFLHPFDALLTDGRDHNRTNPDFYDAQVARGGRSEEHTSELQSLMRISYAVFCLKKKTRQIYNDIQC